MSSFKISSPWISYVHKIRALLGEDPDIRIKYDEAENKLSLYVKGTDKADALSCLLPAEKDFGGTVIRTVVIPANMDISNKADLVEAALKGNPVFRKMTRVNPGSSNSFNYAVFARRIAQFWDDNLGDPHGNISCLYQDLAKELFEDTDGVMFCTDNIGEIDWF